MKHKVTYFLTKKEQKIINEFLDIWRNKNFKGGEIKVPFHNYEPQGIIYQQGKLFSGSKNNIKKYFPPKPT